jgi:hypothetical protein
MRDSRLTVRLLLSWGLVAGLSMTETLAAEPGEVVDLFVYRRRYDDEQHRIRREVERCAD